MIQTHDAILMIEPSFGPSTTPVIDDLTRRMAGALLGATRSNASRGFHECTGCQAAGVFPVAQSDNMEHHVTDIFGKSWLTNSLAVHYLACHRDAVPPEQLNRIKALAAAPAEPTSEQILGYGAQHGQARMRQADALQRGSVLVRDICARHGATLEHLGSVATIVGGAAVLDSVVSDLAGADRRALVRGANYVVVDLCSEGPVRATQYTELG